MGWRRPAFLRHRRPQHPNTTQRATAQVLDAAQALSHAPPHHLHPSRAGPRHNREQVPQ